MFDIPFIRNISPHCQEIREFVILILFDFHMLKDLIVDVMLKWINHEFYLMKMVIKVNFDFYFFSDRRN